jgi:hypothetical protein
MNFQVSIDGGAPSPYQFDGVCGTCNTTYNFTAYNTQSLPFGTHTLDLTLLNATGSNSGTLFNFNYAVVNETNAFPTQPTSIAPTSTTAPAPSTVQYVSNTSRTSHPEEHPNAAQSLHPP